MATPWTLEKELCGLADMVTAAKALVRLGLVDAASPSRGSRRCTAGCAAGPRRTSTGFGSCITRDAVHDLVLKAIVAFSYCRRSPSLAASGWSDAVCSSRTASAHRASITQDVH